MPPREFKYNKEMKNRSYNHRKSRIDFFVCPDHGGASLFDFIKFSQNNGLFSAAIEDIILLCNKIEARKRKTNVRNYLSYMALACEWKARDKKRTESKNIVH